jgi:eukaryotic-like serine/threonine-protein kinase
MSMIGKILGNFEITSQLGKGGMGEVYQAKDRKLGRDVAIKVLPEEFAKDADRVARFQREAKLLASLNHPNIAAIHGLEESDGMHFLVLELIEGATLADRLKGSPIAVAESLKLALQIAEAIEAAHEKGVIHRDLKPANIKVTPDGKVKVLDFGLAKAFAGEQADLNLSNSPTLSEAATQQGVILGTAAYMPPEQAKAKVVDKRADIWAFGVVLFEMLTGRQLFTGETVSETLASVLKSEPEWKSLPPNLHPRIRLLLERCLEKDPKNRYGVISDARVDIQKTLADPSGVLVEPITTVRPRRRLRVGLPWIAAAIVLTAIVAGVAIWKLKPPEPRRVMRFDYDLPQGQQFNLARTSVIAISPDGSQFAYSTDAGLYLRSMEERDARPVMGADKQALDPFFSPDGQWIGYWSEKKLKKIAIRGGAPVTLSDYAMDRNSTWGVDDTIAYIQFGKGIMRVSAGGGPSEVILKEELLRLSAPQILPDGKSVLFTTGNYPYKVVVQSLKSGERKELFAGDSAKYLPTGHIVYALGNNLLAVPFDLGRLEVAGGAVPLVEGIHRQTAPQYDISDSGTLVYVPGTGRAAVLNQRTLVWVDRKGKEEPITATPNDYRSPRISPDGTKLALTINNPDADKSDIWIWDLIRETMMRLTFNEASGVPVWTPDGRRIAFASGSINKSSVYWKAADGTGGDEKLGSAPDRGIVPWSWSKDGKILALMTISVATGFDIGSLSMEGEHRWKPLLQETHTELQPKISPDGQWMAYMSNESGKNEVYVRPFPEVNKGRWQVSTSGGNSPLWSPDGRELFYLSGNAVMAVSVETTPTFKCGKPASLFQGMYARLSLGDAHTWDIAPDGKRFLMMKESGTTASTGEAPRKISIVVNWFEELKQRAPVKR